MTNFLDLDDQDTFKKIVTEHHTSFVGEVGVLTADVVIAENRLDLAHDFYKANIDKFSVLLGGGDPDQYKRAGSLLHALNTAKVIVEYTGTADTQDAEMGWKLGYSFADIETDLNALKFYERYHNEAAAFDLAFRFCDVYEEKDHSYDERYASTVCNYLSGNSNLSEESLFVLFQSLMLN